MEHSNPKSANHANCHHDAGICVAKKNRKEKKSDKKLVFLSQRVYEKAKEHGNSNGTKIA